MRLRDLVFLLPINLRCRISDALHSVLVLSGGQLTLVSVVLRELALLPVALLLCRCEICEICEHLDALLNKL